MSAGAKYLEILVERGRTFTLKYAFLGPDGSLIDLTGYSAKMEVRKGTPDKPDLTPTGLVTTLSSAGSGVGANRITLVAPPPAVPDPNNPPTTVIAKLTDEQTRDEVPMPPTGTYYCYDFVMTDPTGDSVAHLYGVCKVREEITVLP